VMTVTCNSAIQEFNNIKCIISHVSYYMYNVMIFLSNSIIDHITFSDAVVGIFLIRKM
jgi:hypothetical protein